MAGKDDKNLEKQFDDKFKDKQVGEPFSTDRDLVEEGKPRQGTNLDLGEERSREQKKEIEKIRKNKND